LPFPTNAICNKLGTIGYLRLPWTGLDQVAIFHAKEFQSELQHIAISRNKPFTILAIACLFSFPELVTIEAHGLEISAEKLLFCPRRLSLLETALNDWKQRKTTILWTS